MDLEQASKEEEKKKNDMRETFAKEYYPLFCLLADQQEQEAQDAAGALYDQVLLVAKAVARGDAATLRGRERQVQQAFEGLNAPNVKDKKACRDLLMTHLCSKKNSRNLTRSQLLHGRWYLTYLQFDKLLSEFLRETGFTKSNWLEGLEGKKAEDFRVLFVVQY